MVRSTTLALALYFSCALQTVEAVLINTEDFFKDVFMQDIFKAFSTSGGEQSSLGVDDVPSETVSCDALRHVPSDVTALYINLDSRKDRQESFLESMKKFMEPFQRCKAWTLNRFQAIDAHSLLQAGQEMNRHTGQVAAASSHVAALKQLERSSKGPVLIFEDDFRFNKQHAPSVLVQKIDKAFQGLGNDWDVIMMGANSYFPGGSVQGLGKEYGLVRTKGAWCSEAYMVNQRYLPTLLNTTSSGLTLLQQGASHVNAAVEPLGAAYDTLWYPLQQDPKAKWIVFVPSLGQQENTWGDSNIDSFSNPNA